MNPASLLLPTAAALLPSPGPGRGGGAFVPCVANGSRCTHGAKVAGRKDCRSNEFPGPGEMRRDHLGCLMTKPLSQIHFAGAVTAYSRAERKLMIAGPGLLPSGVFQECCGPN